MTKRKFNYCVRLPREPMLSTNYNNLSESPIFTKAYSEKQAVPYIIFKRLRKDAAINTMVYLKENRGDTKGDLSRYVLDLEDLEQRVAVSKIEGSLIEVQNLPKVTIGDMQKAAARKLGGRPESYEEVVKKYFNQQSY